MTHDYMGIYDEKIECPKCGSGEHSANYFYKNDREGISVKCNNCGFMSNYRVKTGECKTLDDVDDYLGKLTNDDLGL